MKYLLLLLLLLTSCVAEKQTIYIAAFYPDSYVVSAPNALHTASYTQGQINNNTLGLLRDYNIEVIWKNTLCIERYALNGFIEFLRDTSRRYLVLLGPICTDPLASIAQISHFYGLSLFTYTNRSPSLGNILRYPGFIRGSPSDVNIVAGWIKFIQYYNWTRLAILNQQGDYFLSTSQEAQLILKGLNIEHYIDLFDPESIRFDEQVETVLSRVNSQGYRIMIINAYPQVFVKVLCHLKKFPSLQPPSTTIFTYGWYGTRWYGDVAAATGGECSLEDIQRLSRGVIGFNSLPSMEELLNATDTMYSGKTPIQVYQELREYVSEIESELFFDREFRIEEMYLYDSLWGLALALNRTIELGHNLSQVGDYTAGNIFNSDLNQNIRSLNFLGWSGQVSFVGNERYDNRVHILEFINASLEYRGHLRNIPSNTSSFVDSSEIIIDLDRPFTEWDPALASDGILQHPTHVVIFPLILLLAFLASVYVTAVITIILVSWYKRMKPVTLSEPIVTITILSGTYFLFIYAVMLTLDGRYLSGSSYEGGRVFCQSRTWVLSVSISIIFGGMLAKAGKFYILIIKNGSEYSKHLKPIYIVMFPLFLVILDTAYFIIWLLVSPNVLYTHEIDSGLMNPPRYIVTECGASYRLGEQVFLWLLIALKSLLVIIGLFLAYNLRKVTHTHKSLRYTDTITWTIYNTSIFTLGIVLILFLVESRDLRSSLSAFLSLIEGVVAASIVSGPVLYYLIRDPEGNTLFNAGNQGFPEGKDLLEKRIQALVRDNDALKKLVNRKSAKNDTLPLHDQLSPPVSTN